MNSNTLGSSSGVDIPVSSESRKRPRTVRQACQPCRFGKRKCDGQLPCSYCVSCGKRCFFSQDGRKSRPSNVGDATATSYLPAFSSLSNPPIPQQAAVSFSSNAIDSPTSMRFDPSLVDSFSFDMALMPTESQTPVQVTQIKTTNTSDDNTLARIVHVMTNGRVSRYASPTAGLDDGEEGENGLKDDQTTDLLEKLHRHLTTVFSLTSVTKDKDGEENTGIDDLSTFFMPSREEGTAYMKCYFDYATSTYRYLDRRAIEAMTEEFYDSAGCLRDSDRVCLLLLLMATGCLWTPAWNGSDPQIMTRKAVRLFRAAKRRLRTLSLSQPRLVTVQIYIAVCHLNLGMARFQAAWLAFGTAARLGQLLRLHRKSSTKVSTEEDQSRRTVFWTSFMMDRYLALVLGCPVLYDERDITQPLPLAPSSAAEAPEDEEQRLTGALAHIKLSRILGHALRALQSPTDIQDVDRRLIVQSLKAELDTWVMETPRFFQPATTQDAEQRRFAVVPPFFERQQHTVRNAYHFIELFIHRSFLLAQFINRVPQDNSPAAPVVMSPEVDTCVEAAIAIAKSVSKSKGRPGSKGTFWNSAYFCFASLTVLLVYLMVYEDPPRRQEIENIIEAAMEGHMQLTGTTTRELEQILSETRRITKALQQRSENTSTNPSTWEVADNTFQAGYGLNGEADMDRFTTNWDPLWQDTLDMLGLHSNLNIGTDWGTEGLQTGALDFLQ